MNDLAKMQEAKAKNAAMLFLPECCVFIGRSQQEVSHYQRQLAVTIQPLQRYSPQKTENSMMCVSMQTVSKAQPLDGPLMKRFQQLACDNQIWLSLGGFQVCSPYPAKKPLILQLSPYYVSNFKCGWLQTMCTFVDRK